MTQISQRGIVTFGGFIRFCRRRRKEALIVSTPLRTLGAGVAFPDEITLFASGSGFPAKKRRRRIDFASFATSRDHF